MHPLLTLLLQIGVVIVVARLVGLAFRALRQPQVVGEMAAGILLGPSLLGWTLPGVSAVLFPPPSLPTLGLISQLGLIFFMFLVGLEFDPKLLRGRARAAVITSHVSIAVPFFLGSVLALYLYPRLSDASVPFTGFALFMGAAMSVTAFPVLARILDDRNLFGTRVGALTLMCAAVGDVTAWSILAVVIAVVRSSELSVPLWVTLAGSTLYAALMLLGVRRALRWLESFHRNRGELTQDMVAMVLLLLLASAWTTEWLGIHALFGAFTLGAVMPKGRDFVRDLNERLEDFTVVLLLPLFFAFTGLQTSVRLISSVEMWGYLSLILAVALAGKFGGSTISARLTGLGWREAGALGILMNTRGLMELVILTIGHDLGLISSALFTMMVLMALITTMMTTPVLEWIYPERLLRRALIEAQAGPERTTVLVPLSLPSSGPGLMRAARMLSAPDRELRVYAAYLGRAQDRRLVELQALGAWSPESVLGPALEAARAEKIDVRPVTFVSHDVAADLADLARSKCVDLVLMGWHKPVFGKSILGGTVRDVMASSPRDIAVLVDRGRWPWQRVLVPFREGPNAQLAIGLARRIAAQGGAEVTLLHVIPPDAGDGPPDRGLDLPETGSSQIRVRVVRHEHPLEALVQEAAAGYDLVAVGVPEPGTSARGPFGLYEERIVTDTPASLLVVRAGAPGGCASAEASVHGRAVWDLGKDAAAPQAV
jgi:Kef-type K+ transport system membrane component KefB